MLAGRRDETASVTKSLAMNREECGTIIGVKGELTGKYFRFLPHEKVLIGKDKTQCDLCLSDARISRIHCEVYFNADKKCYSVKDVSKNGVVLDNKAKLKKDVLTDVPPGSHLFIGSTDDEVVLG